MKFSAVIFDLDGTLLDTESSAISSGIKAFADQGIEIEKDWLDQLVGIDVATGTEIIRQAFGDLDMKRLNRVWYEEARKAQADGIDKRPGAEALLSHISQVALPRAVATSSSRKDAHRKLRTSGLAPHFDVVVSFDCVRLPKPAPEPFLLAAARLGVDPAHCIAFEDSDTGARSAYAAGMQVVQVPDVLASKGEHAHHLADSLLAGARQAGLL